jgi:hypothetical protein
MSSYNTRNQKMSDRQQLFDTSNGVVRDRNDINQDGKTGLDGKRVKVFCKTHAAFESYSQSKRTECEKLSKKELNTLLPGRTFI